MTHELGPRLDDRLARLADPPAVGDWVDVQRRAGRLEARRARRRVAVLAAAAVLVGAALLPAAGLGTHVLDFFGVSETTEEVPRISPSAPEHPYVYGDELEGYGKTRRLAAPVLAPLRGKEGPLAVPSPDGRYVAYHTWERGTPTLRVYDVKTGRDRLLAEGAQDVAWGQRGIAYVQAVHPRYVARRAYAGRIVVRRSLGSAPETWVASPGQYTVYAWARDRLLVRSRGCNLAGCVDPLPTGTYVLDGRAGRRSLGGFLPMALSASGRYAFGPFYPVAGQDSPSSLVQIVDLQTGRRVVRLDLRRAVAAGVPRSVVEGGVGTSAWARDRIVAVSSAGRNSSLVFFRFRHRRLTVEQVLRLDENAGLRGRHGGPFLSTPVFADARARVVSFSADLAASKLGYVSTILTCDRVTRTCRRGRFLRPARWLALVHNPSRPLPARGRTD